MLRAFAAKWRQLVFDVRRNDRSRLAFNQPIAFERAQRLREHFLGDAADDPAQFRIALSTGDERAKNEATPAAKYVVENLTRRTAFVVTIAYDCRGRRLKRNIRSS